MKVKYDKEVDIVYIQLNDSEVSESDESREGVILDYDAHGNIVGTRDLSHLFSRRIVGRMVSLVQSPFRRRAGDRRQPRDPSLGGTVGGIFVAPSDLLSTQAGSEGYSVPPERLAKAAADPLRPDRDLWRAGRAAGDSRRIPGGGTGLGGQPGADRGALPSAGGRRRKAGRVRRRNRLEGAASGAGGNSHSLRRRALISAPGS